MKPGHNGNDPDVSERLAMNEAKAAHPPGGEPKTLAVLHGWPLARKVLRIVIGVFLLLLGLAALLTPLTPGSWLALVGLEFLGLRVLLRNWLCARARARPQSRLRRVACRVFSVGHRDATKRTGWRRWFRRTPDVARDEPRHRQGKDRG